MSNPLLQDWKTPLRIAPFDVISDDDFAPALDQALAAHRSEIAAIASSAEEPTFTAPDVGPSGASLTFQLTVTDDGGLQSTDSCVVTAS